MERSAVKSAGTLRKNPAFRREIRGAFVKNPAYRAGNENTLCGGVAFPRSAERYRMLPTENCSISVSVSNCSRRISNSVRKLTSSPARAKRIQRL